MEELKILRQLNILKCQQAGPGTKHQRPVGNQQGSKNETEMKKSSRWHDPKTVSKCDQRKWQTFLKFWTHRSPAYGVFIRSGVKTYNEFPFYIIMYPLTAWAWFHIEIWKRKHGWVQTDTLDTNCENLTSRLSGLKLNPRPLGLFTLWSDLIFRNNI